LPAFYFDVAATVAAVQDFVAPGHSDDGTFAVIAQLAGTDGQDSAPLRFLLGGVGQKNTTCGLFLGFQRLHDDPVVQGPDLQVHFLFLCHDESPLDFRILNILHVHATHATHPAHATAHATHA